MLPYLYLFLLCFAMPGLLILAFPRIYFELNRLSNTWSFTKWNWNNAWDNMHYGSRPFRRDFWSPLKAWEKVYTKESAGIIRRGAAAYIGVGVLFAGSLFLLHKR